MGSYWSFIQSKCACRKKEVAVNENHVENHTESPTAVPPRSETNKYIALFKYESRGANDLSLSKGDHLEMIRYNESGWSLVRNTYTQMHGYVPSNYIVSYTGIEDKPWYYGPISSTDATKHLKASGEEGLFLVRQSSDERFRYTLSVLNNEQVKHFRLQEAQGKYCIFQQEFDSIEQLIEYYTTHELGANGFKLTFPLQIKQPPETADVSLIGSITSFQVEDNQLQFVRIIGRGNFSEVWEGTLDGLPVAIKTFKNHTFDMNVIVREAMIIARLNHPNLVALFGIHVESPPYYLIFELLPKGDLLRYLRTNVENLSDRQLVKFATQVANGMKFLEDRKCIHRDLAARNVLVGDNDSVKIADFGLALLNDSNRLVTFKPIRWMAPEAYFNDQFSNKSDVWSFGVLLYEIFSLGNDPYKDGHIDQIMDRVKNGMRLERPTRAPEDIYQLMESTWQDNPELRPSFADIFQTLNNITL